VLRLALPLAAPEDGAVAGERKAGGRMATLEEVEKAHIRAVLEACDGKISGAGGAAEVLGLHPNTLRSRLKKLGLAAGRRGRSASSAEPRP
jgi:transcriptional regulator with GAF, ATPase, and Fis domain